MTSLSDRLSVLSRLPGDVVALARPDGEVVYVSPSVERTLGYPVDEYPHLGRHLIHPADVAVAGQRWTEVLEQPGAEVRWEMRLEHATQGYRWFEVIAVNTLDDDTIAAVYTNFRDVHERRLADEARAVAQRRLDAVLRHSPDVTVLLDPTGMVLWASPALGPMLGWREDDVTGTSAFDLVHPDDVDAARQRFADAVALDLRVEPITLRILAVDGTFATVEVAGLGWRDGDVLEGIVLNLRDVGWRLEAEATLRRSEQRFRALVQHAYEVVIVLDEQGRLAYATPSIEHLFGRPVAQILGHTGLDWVHPDDVEQVAADLAEVIATPGATGHTSGRVRHADGAWRWIEATSVNLLHDDAVRGIVVNTRDVTDRVEAHEETRERERLFRSLAHSSPTGIFQHDAQGKCVFVNDRWSEITGYPHDAALGTGWRRAVHPDDMALIDRAFADRADDDDGGDVDIDFRVVRPDHQVRWVSARATRVVDQEGSLAGRIGTLEDVTERVETEQRLAHQATHDPLTGLPNRALLLDRLGMALARARRRQRRTAVLFLDLDHFKVVNDSLGHSLGDRLLVEVAARLTEALRPEDTVARFGGDEFVVLCEDLHDQFDAESIAERIIEAIGGPFTFDDTEIYIGASIGIAFPDALDVEPETFIRDADAAMYQAKERGRGRWVVFDNAMRANAVDRLDIEIALRRSIERRELRIHYQPVVSVATGLVVGVEALVRWEHPERGLLLPSDFIAVAEETGLIVPIGTWVLQQACRQVHRWEASLAGGPRLSVAVNLSGRQLLHPGLVDDVAAVITSTGIDPGQVELEITESVLMDDVETSSDTLGRLKQLGVRLAVDDFGTGYSSLSYLRRFPVDLLKVDRSFVDGLGHDPSDSAIVEAIITLAHTLGLEAVAEGVETPVQLRELRALGCDLAQGFLLARPATGDVVAEGLEGRVAPRPTAARRELG